MVRSSVRAVVLVVFVVVVVVAVERLKVVLFGLGMRDMPDPELVEVVIKDNLGAYKEMFDGCRV
jgi:hypothetical protein